MGWTDTLITVLSYIGWFFLILVGGGFSAFLTYLLLFKRRKIKKRNKELSRDLLQTILTHMMRVRHILIVDIDTKATFEKELEFWGQFDTDDKLRFFKDVGNIVAIEDFYTVLRARFVYLDKMVKEKPSEDIDSRELIKKSIRIQNEKCLHSVENALKIIDWDKYNI